MDYNHIKINPDKAEKILLEVFGIEGTASPLPGYVDFNFKIKTKEEKICFKDISTQ
jgi:Ser/Thr protein kinase RdoA (MazF antagonist)